MDAVHKIIIIAGPTASGKTQYGINLALSFNGEIVNCDSRQVYKYMDIGTAKPDAVQRAAVKHHMIDVVEPSSRFNAARYVAMADKSIEAVHDAGRISFVVGGTGLYIKALLHGLAPIPCIDEAVRADIRKQQMQFGNDALYHRLRQIDPVDAASIRSSDTYRLIRALEVFTATGLPLRVYLEQHGFSEERYDRLYIVLHNPDKTDYHAVIDRRVDAMIQQGLVDEVRRLLDNGYGEDLQAMKTVGYAEIVAHLGGRTSLDQAVEMIKKHTKAYAKRQITWFKGVKNAVWTDGTSGQEIQERMKRFLYA